MLAYLDESGDLGFDFAKPGTSHFFVVAAVVCSGSEVADKVVKKVFRGFTKTDLKHHGGSLHSYTETPATRQRLLRLVVQQDVSVFVIRLDKRIYALRGDKHALYNHLVGVLLSSIVSSGVAQADGTLQVVASQRETSRGLNRDFVSYLRRQVAAPDGLSVDIQIKPAASVKGLQVVDCLSWSFCHKYECGDATYAEIVAGKVIEEIDINDC